LLQTIQKININDVRHMELHCILLYITFKTRFEHYLTIINMLISDFQDLFFCIFTDQQSISGRLLLTKHKYNEHLWTFIPRGWKNGHFWTMICTCIRYSILSNFINFSHALINATLSSNLILEFNICHRSRNDPQNAEMSISGLVRVWNAQAQLILEHIQN
jgi:hypothetical protein